MRPWIDRLLAFVQVLALAVALGSALAWFELRTSRAVEAIRDQVDRTERSIAQHRRYIVARDREWAESIGLPVPPVPEGIDP